MIKSQTEIDIGAFQALKPAAPAPRKMKQDILGKRLLYGYFTAVSIRSMLALLLPLFLLLVYIMHSIKKR